MCGILGAYGGFGADRFENALNKLSHRGPDFSGTYFDGSLSLGHARLSIIDLLPEANQPFLDGNFAIVFNGEIYNYRELSKKYSLELHTTSDTEVLLKLYEKIGVECLSELNGMFAFCVYDKKSQTLTLARDRFGKKPLYYFFDGSKFVFASEIKAILELLDKTPSINRHAFEEYLSYLSPMKSNTFYEGIQKLEAGCTAVFDIETKKLDVGRYYELSSYTQPLAISEKEALSKIEELIFDSLRLRLVSDVPVASFLSGGVDSTLISALYSSISQKKIDTFSIGYDEYKDYDELHYARMASNSMGSNHHEFTVNKKEFLDAFEEIVPFLDEPFNDPAIIPTFMLSREVNKSGYKVILSGEGSDEIFMGYDAYFDYLKLDKINHELSSGSKDFMDSYHAQNQNLSRNYESLRRIYERDLPIFRLIGESFNPLQKSKLLSTNPQNIDTDIKAMYETVKDQGAAYWMSYIDIRHWIGEVLMSKMDRMSMAHSLESRAPFLDYRLVEFAMSLPPDIRVGNTTKALLKKIAEKHIPKEIVYRQKKGFSSPYFEWYYEAYGDKILEEFMLVNKELGWFNDEFLRFLFEQGKMGKFKQHTWGLILFCRWFINRFM